MLRHLKVRTTESSFVRVTTEKSSEGGGVSTACEVVRERFTASEAVHCSTPLDSRMVGGVLAAIAAVLARYWPR